MGRKKGRGRPPKGSGPAASTSASKDGSKEDAAVESGTVAASNPKSKKGKANRHQERTVVMRLADKPDLTKEDLMCPICWSTLFEPTTLPCNHSLCEVCFRTHVRETSLQCPCCRLRLSVWSRKVAKENQLLDEALWNRMKIEFPRLVEARSKGLDTQNIMGDEEGDISQLCSPPPQTSGRQILDGTLCEEPGKLKEELQHMLEQHQKDIEEERKREETASACLIKQMQEEEQIQQTNNAASEEQDFLLAEKLQKEFQEENKHQRSILSTQQQNKSAQRNLMKEWINNNPYSPDICVTPMTKGIKAKSSPSSQSSNGKSSKGKSTSNKAKTKKKLSVTVSSDPDISRASQNIMSNFLSLSQNQLVSPESPSSSAKSIDSETPCCSKSLPIHDIRFSAFSPTKPSTSLRLFVPAESLAIPISSVTDNLSPVTSRTVAEELGTNSTKTPDSINSEVDRHFRPIRGAPKTPQRRRPDGTFLPEVKLLRSTPLKPGTSASIAAYIRSPLKQMPDDSRPSCATVEKRISNDSGYRASDDSRSPDIDGIGESPTVIVKGSDNGLSKTVQPHQNERGRISEDYRVTPEDNPKTPENSKKRFHIDDNDNISSDSKKLKVESIQADSRLISPDRAGLHTVKQEIGSPSLLEESFGHVPLSFDITCTQGIMTIEEDDEEYLGQEAEALKNFRKKAEQEAADRAFAEALQRDLNRRVASPRGGHSNEKKYSLRSWLGKSQVKPETK